MKRLFLSLLQPKQVVVTDITSGKAARHFTLRPIWLMLAPGLLALGFFFAGMLYSPPTTTRTPAYSSRIQQLLQENHALQTKLAEQEALLALRNDQIENMKKTMTGQERNIADLQDRLDMFESILNQRKNPGLHLIEASAYWEDPMHIGYRILLVKGGNYPRRKSGVVRLFALDSHHDDRLLVSDQFPDGLPYQMETHTLLQGSFPWLADWKPTQLAVVVLNEKGKEIERSILTIGRSRYVTQ